jgi:hypothetical protein
VTTVTDARPVADQRAHEAGPVAAAASERADTAVNPLDDPEFVAGLRPVPSGDGDAPVAWPAVDISGVTPEGASVEVELDARQRPVLLVFLSTRCDGCDLFWNGVRNSPPTEVDVVVVTKGPGVVSSVEVGAHAAGTQASVVLSDEAWVDYRVTGYPFLVVVDPATRTILGESVGFGWSDVGALIERAGRS